MTSLWPNDIQSAQGSFAEILQTQADELPKASENRLFAYIDQIIIDNVVILKFQLFPNGRQEHTYELFRLRAPNGEFPVAIETYHFDPRRNIEKAEDSRQLENVLRRLFHDARTIEILNLLKDGARDQGGRQTDDTDLLIGAQMFKGVGGELCAMVSFFGVSTFIDINVIERLLLAPDTKGSPYQTLDTGRVITTVPVLAPLKMTLSKHQVDALQKAAQLTLKSKETAE